jgi:hypothetical protein
LTWALVLTNLHDYTTLTGLTALGLLLAVSKVLTYLFRVMGEVVDSYYDFRTKCVQARLRFQQSMEERAKGRVDA